MVPFAESDLSQKDLFQKKKPSRARCILFRLVFSVSCSVGLGWTIPCNSRLSVIPYQKTPASFLVIWQSLNRKSEKFSMEFQGSKSDSRLILLSRAFNNQGSTSWLLL
jgi:hypothetical protein